MWDDSTELPKRPALLLAALMAPGGPQRAMRRPGGAAPEPQERKTEGDTLRS